MVRSMSGSRLPQLTAMVSPVLAVLADRVDLVGC